MNKLTKIVLFFVIINEFCILLDSYFTYLLIKTKLFYESNNFMEWINIHLGGFMVETIFDLFIGILLFILISYLLKYIKKYYSIYYYNKIYNFSMYMLLLGYFILIISRFMFTIIPELIWVNNVGVL